MYPSKGRNAMKKWLMLVIIGLIGLVFVGCQRDANAIVSVAQLDAKHVPQFTPFDALDLPDEVTVTLANGDTHEVRIAWDRSRGRYASDRVDTYALTGELIITGQVTNPDEKTVVMHIHVEAEDMISTLIAHGGFTKLLNAIDAANLTDLIASEEPLTLFAPTDEAFDALLSAINMTEAALHDAPWLEEVLLFHLLDRRHSLSSLIGFTPMMLDTKQGEPIRFDLANERLRLNLNVMSTGQEWMASNGVIHEVDGLLLPVSVIAEIGGDVIADQLFDVLLELIASGDIPLDLLALLMGGGLDAGLTVFLPEEAVLLELAETLDITLETLFDSPVFIDVLLYHITLETYLISDLFSDAPLALPSLQGEAIEITREDDELFINTARIISSESLFDFGVVHIIDDLLIPPSLIDQWPDVVTED